MAKVNPWGNKDNADGVPIFAPAYVNQATTDENASALYEAEVVVGDGTGVKCGVYGVTGGENDKSNVAHSGWSLTKTGTGGRAGRVQTEVLVCIADMQSVAPTPDPGPVEPEPGPEPGPNPDAP